MNHTVSAPLIPGRTLSLWPDLKGLQPGPLSWVALYFFFFFFCTPQPVSLVYSLITTALTTASTASIISHLNDDAIAPAALNANLTCTNRNMPFPCLTPTYGPQCPSSLTCLHAHLVTYSSSKHPPAHRPHPLILRAPSTRPLAPTFLCPMPIFVC